MKVIYTVGYTAFQSGHSVDTTAMCDVLHRLGVTHIVDVRTVPYSKMFPECNENRLRLLAKEKGLMYVHISQLGAKASVEQNVFSQAGEILDEDIYPISKSDRPNHQKLCSGDEIVDFDKFMVSPIFKLGLERICTAYSKGYTLALMCSEKRAIDCHRFFLISLALEDMYRDILSVRHVSFCEGDVCLHSNEELKFGLMEEVCKRVKIKKLLEPSLLYPPVVDMSDREAMWRFCYKYWNLLHGWSRSSVGVS